MHASWKDGVISLSFEQSFNVARAEESDFQQVILDHANRLSGKNNKMKIEQFSSAIPSTETPKEQGKERLKLDTPIIQKAVSIFGATVDDIEPIN